MELQHLIFSLVSYLSVGTVTSLGFVKHQNVGKKYYLYHGLGAVFLCVAAYFWFGHNALGVDSAYWFIGFAVTASIYSIWVLRYRRLSRTAYFLSITCAIGFIALDIMTTTPSPLHVRMLANSFLSSLLLGFSMASMLLGHWYLTMPKMPISELARVTRVLTGLIEARFIFATYVLGTMLWGKNEQEIMQFLTQHPGLFVVMRYLWGILVPLILTFMVRSTVKIRSTQSATGILYVLVLAVLTGEILSLYLAFYYGIAL